MTEEEFEKVRDRLFEDLGEKLSVSLSLEQPFYRPYLRVQILLDGIPVSSDSIGLSELQSSEQ